MKVIAIFILLLVALQAHRLRVERFYCSQNWNYDTKQYDSCEGKMNSFLEKHPNITVVSFNVATSKHGPNSLFLLYSVNP